LLEKLAFCEASKGRGFKPHRKSFRNQFGFSRSGAGRQRIEFFSKQLALEASGSSEKSCPLPDNRFRHRTLPLAQAEDAQSNWFQYQTDGAVRSGQTMAGQVLSGCPGGGVL